MVALLCHIQALQRYVLYNILIHQQLTLHLPFRPVRLCGHAHLNKERSTTSVRRPGLVRRLPLPQTRRERTDGFVSEISSMCRSCVATNTCLTTWGCCATLHVCENQANVKCVRQRVITLLASTNCIVRAVRRTFCHYGEGASIDRVQRRPADGRVFLCFQVC